jgi:hypothetical protein
MTASEMARKRWQGVPRAERVAMMRAAAAKAAEVHRAKAEARKAAREAKPEPLEEMMVSCARGSE